jgi:Fe-S cluster biogenesis protein NfuA
MITKEQIESVLDQIRVGLRAEGGDIELVDIKDNIIYVRLTGTCKGCPMSNLTMKNWVEAMLKKELPEIVAVHSI